VDSTLAYIDQGSFLGLRALGRVPTLQFAWVYEHPVDLDGLRRFHRNLSQGLLGRRIERSPLPFGRHHWVTWRGPADIEVSGTVRARGEVANWADEQLHQPVDPECGPPWRLAVQPLTDGGTAVSLVTSHTTCDGLAFAQAIAEAARGVTRALGYPDPGSRTRGQALRQDTLQMVREVPEIAKAVVAAARLARNNRGGLTSSAGRSAPPDKLDDAALVTAPWVAVYIDEQVWIHRAENLGGTSNSLFAGIAARLGQILGRADDQGRVTLVFPVSERTEDDTRGNALSAMNVIIDPAGVTASLRDVRAELKRSLAALSETSNELLGPLALTPLVPRRLARRLESVALGASALVGCSNLGRLDPATNRPDGTDAEFILGRQADSRITAAILDRLGGVLFLVSFQVNGKVVVTVTGWKAGGPNSREELARWVRTALDDFGLTGVFEPASL
jgi:diacylglycerol O-acyltransferase